MKQIADIAAVFFIFAVVVLGAISILGVWEFFDGGVIEKSFLSIGLLALVAVIVIVADHLMDKSPVVPAESMFEAATHPTFTPIRKLTLVSLIISVVLLTFLGLLAIWEVLIGEVLEKSLTSIAILGFSSFIIVMTCLERENNPLLRKKFGVGGFIGALLFMWLLAALISVVLS